MRVQKMMSGICSNMQYWVLSVVCPELYWMIPMVYHLYFISKLHIFRSSSSAIALTLRRASAKTPRGWKSSRWRPRMRGPTSARRPTTSAKPHLALAWWSTVSFQHDWSHRYSDSTLGPVSWMSDTTPGLLVEGLGRISALSLVF